MHPIILIPARMQSTRLPEKPLVDIGGTPMIVHVLNRALAADIAPVYVACDDVQIADAVQKAGGKTVMTGTHHASGSDRIYEALQQIDPHKKYDVVINLQGDVPTIEPATIRAVLAPLANAATDIATLACEITLASERVDPAVVKPVLSFITPSLARALYFSRSSIPHGAGALYHHIGIYAYRRTALEQFVGLPPSPLELREKLEQLRALEAGIRIDVAIVDAVPLGVDTQEHLERARAILGTQP
jgi:3-deoxy-manno-octulosonate cytidylyltransferase (CMP-KDO synthetase)